MTHGGSDAIDALDHFFPLRLIVGAFGDEAAAHSDATPFCGIGTARAHRAPKTAIRRCGCWRALYITLTFVHVGSSEALGPILIHA